VAYYFGPPCVGKTRLQHFFRYDLISFNRPSSPECC